MARPPRANREDDKMGPFQGLQDLQRIAEKTRVETQAPNKTLHTLLFTADLPEEKESPALRRPLGTFPSRQNQQHVRSPSPCIAPPSPDLGGAPRGRGTQRPSTAHGSGRGALGLLGHLRQRLSSPDLRRSSPDLTELGRVSVLTASPTAFCRAGGGQGDDDDAGPQAGVVGVSERASSRNTSDTARETAHGGNSLLTSASSCGGAGDQQAARPGGEQRSRIGREMDFIRAKVAQTVDLRCSYAVP